MAVLKCMMEPQNNSHLATNIQRPQSLTTLTPPAFSYPPSTPSWYTASPATVTPYGIDLGKSDGQPSLSDPFLNNTNETNKSRGTQPNKPTPILWNPNETPNETFSHPSNLKNSPCTTRQREATETELDDSSNGSAPAATKDFRICTQCQKINRLRSRNNKLSVQVKNDALALVAKEFEIQDGKDVIERLRLRIRQLEFEYMTQEIEDKDHEFRGVVTIGVVG
jgi:hypothetical protein